jgi:hypothetical protein
MSLHRTRWFASAGWVVLILATFLALDIADGDGVSGWALAAVLALLPPLVVMVLSNQETPSAATALHIVEKR